jgi:hypothetical protein
MNQCTQQTLSNPYVQMAIKYWYAIVIAIMAVWIIKRGIK